MSAAASSSLSLKEYLKRYESGSNDKEKKKKKKKKDIAAAAKLRASGVLIVDEDPVWQRPVRLDEEEDISDAPGEDEPVVDEDVEVKRLRRLELLRAKKPYLSISDDGSGWVAVDAPRAGTRNNTPSPDRGAAAAISGAEDLSPPRQRRRKRHFTPSPEPEGRGNGRAPSESEDEGNTRGSASAYRDRSPDPCMGRRMEEEGDLYPRRRARHDSPDPEASPPGDLSPPRRKGTATAASHEDMSPPRRDRRNRDVAAEDMSPPRRNRAASPEDLSLLRRNRDLSPPRRNRAAAAQDLSPPRRNKAASLQDMSPPRRNRAASAQDLSPPRRNKAASLQDMSPPRRNRATSPARGSQRSHLEEDISPTRLSGRVTVSDRGGRSSPGADLSPPRKQSRRQQRSTRKLDENMDTDISPPRRIREGVTGKQDYPDLSPPRRGGDELTSRGERRGGLYTGGQIKEEIDRKKAEALSKYALMDPNKSGKGAEPVFRDKATGKRISKEEMLKLEEKGKEKPKEIKLEWGKGLAQKRDAEANALELELEKERPFARTKDDPELDKMLKERIRWGDPMAHLVKRKDFDLQLKDFGDDEKMKESGFVIPQAIPSHSWIKRGIDPPANRYGIKPGRHWDGVDRSTGYEKELFKRQNEKRATQTEAYLWSVSDM